MVRSKFEPATSRTAVRCSTNWANRSAFSTLLQQHCLNVEVEKTKQSPLVLIWARRKLSTDYSLGERCRIRNCWGSLGWDYRRSLKSKPALLHVNSLLGTEKKLSKLKRNCSAAILGKTNSIPSRLLVIMTFANLLLSCNFNWIAVW